MPGQNPKKQFRMGLVVASVFDQPTDNGTIFNVGIHKLYKNEGDSEWSRSTSFNRDDLPLVAKVAADVNAGTLTLDPDGVSHIVKRRA